MISAQTVRAWAPAPGRRLPSPFGTQKQKLGQTTPDLLSSPYTAIATDVLVVIGASTLWWAIGKHEKETRAKQIDRVREQVREGKPVNAVAVATGLYENRWKTFWGLVAAIGIVKTLHDMSRPT